ncbi:MAG TPA: class I SAM-dependent methyltransferase [Jatrophihabitans sp.]|nr:class I SAM-dependent methyltransferase [Jatrophihabitans sp.]
MPSVPASAEPPDFEAAFAVADRIGGWLTREQARVLWDEAHRVAPDGLIVEIGSHQGRSTVLLAAAGASVVAIDPFVSGAMFGGLATKDRFVANLSAAGVADRVELRQAKSTELRPDWRQPINFLYIDGKHDYWTVSDDLRWAAFQPPGARIAVHDAFSSIGVTLGLLRHVLPGRRLRYLDRTGSLARFEVAVPSAADRLRMLAELPWWLRNVAIKILLRLKLFPVARLVGHQDRADPY